MTKQTAQTGTQIIESLTQQEIASFLDALLTEVPTETVTQVLAQLSPDTGQTLEKILYGSQTSKDEEETSSTDLYPSLAKQQETWQRLWDEWQAIVDEAAQEEGTYMVQDEDWEPPYFDTHAYEKDLESVVIKMQPLMVTAAQHRFPPDHSFVDALRYAEETIYNGIPDWIELYENFDMGEIVTQCVLQWEWIKNDDEGAEVADFAERIYNVEGTFNHTTLHENTVLDFFYDELSEKHQRMIFEKINANKDSALWKSELSDSNSAWHYIYMYYVSEFAPEQYLDKLRPTIAQTWKNGLPILEDLLAKHEYAECLVVVDETLKSLLSRKIRDDETWEPTQSLLLPKAEHYTGPDGGYGSEKKLLDYYRQAATGVGNAELANTIYLQQMVFHHFYDWQKMLDAFAQTPVAVTTHDALYQAWRDLLINRTRPAVPYSLYSGQRRGEPVDIWWLDWLFRSIVDYPKDITKGQGYFHRQMEQWLAALPAKGHDKGDDYRFLRLLTRDLNEIDDTEFSPYPQFINGVIEPSQLATKDDKSRQHFLRLMASSTLPASVMAYWRANLVHYVPRPENATHSNYESHASWMSTLKEVTPSDYEMLLAEWHRKHKRRRNLWRDMAAQGLL
ncbi:MAG: hypothetical protein AAF639_09210 [Chloroflexota bacterium]